MEWGRGTLDPEINEPEVVVGERAIVVIQPVVGEQIRCSVEGVGWRVAGDPASEVPIFDV